MLNSSLSETVGNAGGAVDVGMLIEDDDDSITLPEGHGSSVQYVYLTDTSFVAVEFNGLSCDDRMWNEGSESLCDVLAGADRIVHVDPWCFRES